MEPLFKGELDWHEKINKNFDELNKLIHAASTDDVTILKLFRGIISPKASMLLQRVCNASGYGGEISDSKGNYGYGYFIGYGSPVSQAGMDIENVGKYFTFIMPNLETKDSKNVGTQMTGIKVVFMKITDRTTLSIKHVIFKRNIEGHWESGSIISDSSVSFIDSSINSGVSVGFDIIPSMKLFNVGGTTGTTGYWLGNLVYDNNNNTTDFNLTLGTVNYFLQRFMNNYTYYKDITCLIGELHFEIGGKQFDNSTLF